MAKQTEKKEDKKTPAQILAEKKKMQDAKNAAEFKANGFLNPYSPGVTYEDYLKTLKGDETVEQNLKGKISKEDLTWLLNDLQNLKK